MNRNILEDLMVILKRLASPATEQRAYLEKLGVAPSVDEIALEFDDVVGISRPHLSQSQVVAIDALDELLNEVSDGDETLWHIDALLSEPDWESVRRKAKTAIQKFSSS